MFEMYKSRSTSRLHNFFPIVRINSSNNFYLNRRALEEYIKDFKYAELYFDKDTNRIGIGLRENQTPNSYKINIRGNTAMIHGKRFIKYYGIESTGNKNYKPYYQHDLLIVDLSQPLET